MKKLKTNMFRDVGTLSRAIHYMLDVKYKEFGLQKSQWIFLTRICENPKINFIELANMLKVEKSTAVKAVNKLINLGYVNKEIDPFDKRSANLIPTEKALEMYDSLIEQENKQIDICFKNFGEEEKVVIQKFIKEMSQNMSEEWLKIKK